MTLSKADAARQLGISRTTLYKFIEQGQVSATPDGRIDQAELVRIAPVVDTLKERTRTPANRPPVDTSPQTRAHPEPLVDTVYERPWTDERGRQQTSTVSDLVDIFREQVQLMREELREVREEVRVREARAQEREVLLLRMLHESQQRYDRLLDAPRAPGAPPDDTRPVHRGDGASGSSTIPPAPRPGARPEAPRSAMRRRIVALLQDHPEGLSPAQVRRHLGADKSLANTILAMARDGWLQRVEHGRYVVS